MQREETKQHIETLDYKLCEDFGRACPACRGKMHKHGKTNAKELWTLAGCIRVKISRLRCSVCGHLEIPARELVAETLLSSLAQIFISLCRRNSFEQSHIQLKEDFGIEIPVMTLHAYVRAQADYFDDEIVAATRDLYECGIAPERKAVLEPGQPLYLAIDEGLVRDWAYARGPARSDTKFNIAYCAVFFTGRELVTKSTEAKRRYRLIGRFGHVTATTDIDTYFRELVMLSYQRGYSIETLMFILTDGATYLKNGVEAHFPHAIHLLDIYHLKKKIFEVINRDSMAADRIVSAVHAYSPTALIQLVSDYLVFEEKLLEKKEGLLTYLKRNAQALRNHRHPQAKVHGSAAAEKVVDLVVARRFKNRGMSWTRDGLECLLRFQVMDYNKTLDSYWNKRHDRSIERNSDALGVRTFATSELKISKTTSSSHYYHQVKINDSERTKGIVLYE